MIQSNIPLLQMKQKRLRKGTGFAQPLTAILATGLDWNPALWLLSSVPSLYLPVMRAQFSPRGIVQKTRIMRWKHTLRVS